MISKYYKNDNKTLISDKRYLKNEQVNHDKCHTKNGGWHVNLDKWK